MAAASTERRRTPPPVLVKWGGSLITDKTRPETPRPEVLRRLAAELAEVLPELAGGVVLGHGSGSFGHVAAHHHRLRGRLDPTTQRLAVSAVQAAAARLHRRVVEALVEAGVPAFSLPASAWMIAGEGRPELAAPEVLEHALDFGLVPVTGGDVVLDRSWGAAICSTEVELEAIAAVCGAARVLWLGETPGILDGDGKTVPQLGEDDLPGLRATLGAPRGTDVTGGIELRVGSALALARLGVPSILANGLEPGLLARVLRGETVTGTEVVARPATAAVTGTGGTDHG
ncbi:MAG: hypothetical protein KDD11_16135 [Acidobacteria bacterium]|nr:hypothetical protein [Acidobacteriota bacterium]